MIGQDLMCTCFQLYGKMLDIMVICPVSISNTSQERVQFASIIVKWWMFYCTCTMTLEHSKVGSAHACKSI